MERRFDKHIDNDELNALVPWSTEDDQELHEPSPEAVREAARHAQSCMDCSRKVAEYRQLVGRLSDVTVPGVAPPGADCPKNIDWFDVAAGLRQKFKARRLIRHAALCDHCGPLLRAATHVDDEPTAEEERLLAELKPPSRPIPPPPLPWWRFIMRWLAPAVATILIVAALVRWWPSSPVPLPGAKFAAFAVKTEQRYAQGNLTLDVLSDSQETLNQWFKANLPFSVALPASPPAPGEERPYRLEGARLVQVAGKPAVYIAYRMQTGPAGLVVTRDSVAVASGGVPVHYAKVTFYYRMVEGHKVVSWSLHGLTYALVSQEGNDTQRSCMVCHSPMRDRDLTRTPTPLQ